MPLQELKDSIEFKDVSFTYPGTKRRVLSNLNISIKK
jgi:ABC-type bacteriocin/lantibiotic exporter with double-glycine peptidase domain